MTAERVSAEPDLVVLDRAAVQSCLASVDPVAVVEDVLREHAAGHTVLPAEAYLPWTNAAGAYSRCVAMPGGVRGNGASAYGLKVINAALSNPDRGIERAGGLTLLFDPETARPCVLAEAGLLSAVRTAACTVASLRRLGPHVVDAVTLLGCGPLARAHVELLLRHCSALRTVHVFDLKTERALALAQWAAPRVRVQVHSTARAAVEASRTLITLTTSDSPYLPASWLQPGTFVAHVSLDDLRQEVFEGAQALYVDDLDLVRDNPRRILGRLMAEGVVHPARAGELPARTGGRPLTGTLPRVLAGLDPAVRPSTGTVVSNPFGMAVLDIGLLAAIAPAAATSRSLRLRLV